MFMHRDIDGTTDAPRRALSSVVRRRRTRTTSTKGHRMTDGFTQLGQFDDGDDRWVVMRGSTPAGSWIEIRGYERDADDGDDDPYTMTGAMAIPDRLARRVADTITAHFDVPLAVHVEQADLTAETMRLLLHARQRDWLGYMAALRDVHVSRETINVVIGQMCMLTLSAMAELIDDEDIGTVLDRWLSEAVGVEAPGQDDQFDAEIAALLDKHRGRDD
jgi:hypothetical protein